MNCSEFIDRFSDYFDGVADPRLREGVDDHLASCPSCRRYLEVLERGRELLRGFPAVEISGDFRPRLRHRIYHVEDEEALARGSGSASTAATVLAMALLLTLAAWSPLMRQDPEVELSPIVVSRPAARPIGLRLPGVSVASPARVWAFDGEGGFWDLWEGSHRLLYEHSPLSERYRQPLLRRTSLD